MQVLHDSPLFLRGFPVPAGHENGEQPAQQLSAHRARIRAVIGRKPEDEPHPEQSQNEK